MGYRVISGPVMTTGQILLDLQDRITTRSSRRRAKPARAECSRTRLTRPGDLRAHHYCAPGVDGVRFADPEGETFDEARFLLERAIELDGHYAPALALAAFFETKASAFGRVSDDVATEERARERSADVTAATGNVAGSCTA